MCNLSSPIVFALLSGLLLTGCPEKEEEPAERVRKDYKTASEGFKATIPNTKNLPNQKALDNMKNMMEQTDRAQERLEKKTEEAATAE